MARQLGVPTIFLAIAICCGGAAAAEPNILLIISDDQGIDSSAQYALGIDLPVTPILDGLADSGVVFDNVWATPTCATTRASILTGKHGFRTDFNQTPGVLRAEHTTIQQFLATHANAYASGVFGKWHVGGRDENHPATVGVDYFAGSIGNPGDYFDWDLTINGVTAPTFGYHTTVVTDLAIEWIEEQSGPWFVWVAYSAPHPPFHLPPEKLHQRDLSGSESDIRSNPRNYYLASIEAMDNEIGRLLRSMPDAERENTIVIFVGDNGTPRRVLDQSGISRAGAKGTLDEGGIRVPMLVSGASVTRSAERDDALISVVDLYATIAEVAGTGTTAIHDSVSFFGAFGDDDFEGRAAVFAGYDGRNVQGWAIRDAQYKLLVTKDDGEQLFDLYSDPGESQNLLPGDSTVLAIMDRLERAADEVRNVEGEEDHDEEKPLDITDATLKSRSANCADYVNDYVSMAWDVSNQNPFFGSLTIGVEDGKCVFNTNAIPNHDFNDGRGFPNEVREQDDVFEITSTPILERTITALSLIYDNAIMLNGVKVDLLAAACHGIADERIGCNNPNQQWRFDPMHSSNGFRMDSHNAHTQPNGTYHYHGSPNALFDDSGDAVSPVVGFAADGFPIFGAWIRDGETLRRIAPSYQLRSGSRPATEYDPGGEYDGSFRDDYEYVEGSGDLDECNGATIDGVYGYYITNSYPYMMACFRGTPDPSFRKHRGR